MIEAALLVGLVALLAFDIRARTHDTQAQGKGTTIRHHDARRR